MSILNQQFNNGQYLYPSTQAVPNGQQVVIPQITIPQNLPSFMPNTLTGTQQKPVIGTEPIKVHGMDGAKAYPTQPNSSYAMFDDNDDIFYYKVTDHNNYPISLRRFRFYEEEEPVPEPPPEYVTMDEFRKFKEEMLNGKQSVRSQSGSHESKQYANKQ